MDERQKKIRKEFQSYKFQKTLPDNCGTVCVACGNLEAIDYHHILPIASGGDNRYSNIVPLCYMCHNKVHGMETTMFTRWRPNTGRKKNKPPKGYKDVLLMYFDGKLTWKEVRSMLGLGNEVKARGCWWVEDYANELGIEKYTKRGCKFNERSKNAFMTARVYYKDGTIKETYKYMENGEIKYYTKWVS